MTNIKGWFNQVRRNGMSQTFWMWYGIVFVVWNIVYFLRAEQAWVRWFYGAFAIIMALLALWIWWLRKQKGHNTKLRYHFDYLIDKAEISFANAKDREDVEYAIEQYLDPAIDLLAHTDTRQFPWSKRDKQLITAEVTDFKE